MDTNQYKVIITPTAFREMNRIYEYIAEDLYAEKAAKMLMQQVEDAIQKLKYAPEIHTKIEKFDDLKRNYRKIVIKNYEILYAIDKQNKAVYVSHMYYARRNYLGYIF